MPDKALPFTRGRVTAPRLHIDVGNSDPGAAERLLQL